MASFLPQDLSDTESKIIRSGLARGLRDARRQKSRVNKMDVRAIFVHAGSVIPEFGVAGGIDDDGGAIITMDRNRIGEAGFGDAIARMLTHELNHAERTLAGIEVKTLGQALVSEGFAQLAEGAAGHHAGAYSFFQNAEQMKAFAGQAKQHLEATVIGNGEFGRWFFGQEVEGKPQFPTYSGYALGYALVSSYLKANNLDFGAARHIDAAPIIDAWRKNEFDLEFSEIPPLTPAKRRYSRPSLRGMHVPVEGDAPASTTPPGGLKSTRRFRHQL